MRVEPNCGHGWRDAVDCNVCRPHREIGDTGRLIDALEATGKWWMIGKGKVTDAEPLYGCVIQEPKVTGKVLARVEGNSVEFCVIEALERIRP